MSTTDNILPYAANAHGPVSGHAKFSFWTGVASFPLLIALAATLGFTPAEYLPVSKTGILLLCLQTVAWNVSPLCAVVYAISAIIRIQSSDSTLQGIAIATAGAALGCCYFLIMWILLLPF